MEGKELRMNNNNNKTCGMASNSSLNNGTTRKLTKHLNQVHQFPRKHILVFAYLNYLVVWMFGILRDFLCKLGSNFSPMDVEKNRQGYTPLYQNYENFYRRHVYQRTSDCFNKPIASVPGSYIELQQRFSKDGNCTFQRTGTNRRIINMGSYNYLGFAETNGPCEEAVAKCINDSGVGVASTRCEFGTMDYHLEMERFLAWYLGTEDCFVVGMGFATNSTCIPSLVSKGCLILSDALNHSSLILGCRLSGATIKTFRHNDTAHLEELLIEALTPRERQWGKILIVVEGMYSMEGDIVDLPEIIRLKKRFKAYLYLDEAHSIGSICPKGRGVVEYHGCDSRDVDVRMGTFTKSFNAAGGFIAGKGTLIGYLRRKSHSYHYGTSMAAPIVRQIMGACEIITGINIEGDGRQRVKRLARNVRYFRRRLLQMGFIVYGHPDSPVVPLLIYVFSKMAAFARMMEQRGIAVVVVTFPATTELEVRARFCMSAAHDQKILDHTLKAIDEIGDILRLKYNKPTNTQQVIDY